MRLNRSLLSTVICLASLMLSACQHGKPLWTDSVALDEDPPKARDLLPYPADGQSVEVNPPGFCWTPKDRATRYRLEVRKIGLSQAVISTDPQSSTVYPPFRPVEPDQYEWQIVYINAEGTPFARSKTRRFRISRDASELVMPDIGKLKASLVGLRPRLFLSGDRLSALRESIERSQSPAWHRLRDAADQALLEEPYPEPMPNQPGVPEDQEWLRIFTPAKIGSAHLARLALAFRLTEEGRYLDGALRWLKTLAAWDPKGITSHNLKLAGGYTGNDEASMPMLERMSLAWDWIGDQLEQGDREKVLAAMTERSNQVLRRLREQDFLSHPYDNHSGRAIAFLGEAGLAFLGDIPEADGWLDYVLRCYLTSYPAWGGDEGGWSQGMSYWAFYVFGHANFLEALRQVSGTDVFRRPFYRNTGYLPVYFHPPYAPQGGFGDGSYHPPSEVEGVLTDSLAEIFGDPVLKWQADSVLSSGEKNSTRWREWFMEDLYETLLEGRRSGVKPSAPTALAGAKLFGDIGWVAMHSALGNSDQDVWALFKSSRFGSFSHSHADQNTFQLYAYGHALAIDSGYYPSYGTPHDNYWTRQTMAHNGILVRGRGQAAHTWEAGGRIESFETHGPITLVRGQAADAYNVPQPPSLARDWEKYLRLKLPPMEPNLESFERTVAFVSSETHPILVVHDYLRTSAPTTFDWLLHAINPMTFDIRSGSVSLQEGDARLAVRLESSVPFRFEQVTGFPVQPEFAANTAYVLGKETFTNQSHLTATTLIPAQEIKFTAILVPYRSGERVPEVVRIKSGLMTGFRTSGTEVLVWWGNGASGPMLSGDTKGEGRLLFTYSENGKVTSYLSK